MIYRIVNDEVRKCILYVWEKNIMDIINENVRSKTVIICLLKFYGYKLGFSTLKDFNASIHYPSTSQMRFIKE